MEERETINLTNSKYRDAELIGLWFGIGGILAVVMAHTLELCIEELSRKC